MPYIKMDTEYLLK